MANLSSLFDPDLLRRYDTPGPRYTSYPTAPQFSPGFDESDLRAMAATSNGDPIPRPLSLYLHIPFCTSPCFYCGCNRIITRDTARGAAYLTRLYREVAMASALFDRDRDVEQVHFGGGTPNFLTPAQIAEVMDVLRRHFSFAAPARLDCSIELDPRFITPDDVGALAAADPARQDAMRADAGAAGNAAACRNRRVRAYHHVVRDLHLIVYDDAGVYHRVLEGSAVDGGVGTDIDVVMDHHGTELGDLAPVPAFVGEAEAVAADHRTGVDVHPAADLAIMIDHDPAANTTLVPHPHPIVQDGTGLDDAIAAKMAGWIFWGVCRSLWLRKLFYLNRIDWHPSTHLDWNRDSDAG